LGFSLKRIWQAYAFEHPQFSQRIDAPGQIIIVPLIWLVGHTLNLTILQAYINTCKRILAGQQ